MTHKIKNRKQRIQEIEGRIRAALEQARHRGRRDHYDLLGFLKPICLLDSVNNDKGYVHSERTIVRRLAELAADNPGFAAKMPLLLNPPKHKPQLVVASNTAGGN